MSLKLPLAQLRGLDPPPLRLKLKLRRLQVLDQVLAPPSARLGVPRGNLELTQVPAQPLVRCLQLRLIKPQLLDLDVQRARLAFGRNAGRLLQQCGLLGEQHDLLVRGLGQLQRVRQPALVPLHLLAPRLLSVGRLVKLRFVPLGLRRHLPPNFGNLMLQPG